MRSAVILAAALMAVAVGGLVVTAFAVDRSQAFTLGVAPTAPLKLKASATVCQGPIDVPEGGAFTGITFGLGTEGRPGPALDVTVHEAAADGDTLEVGRELAASELAAGYPDVDEAPEHTVWLREVPAERRIAVCLANRGARRVFVYGNADLAARTSSAYIDGSPAGADIGLRFERRRAESIAALVPAMLQRASLFAGWPAAPWSLAVLAVLVVLGVPLLLLAALRATARD